MLHDSRLYSGHRVRLPVKKRQAPADIPLPGSSQGGRGGGRSTDDPPASPTSAQPNTSAASTTTSSSSSSSTPPSSSAAPQTTARDTVTYTASTPSSSPPSSSTSARTTASTSSDRSTARSSPARQTSAASSLPSNSVPSNAFSTGSYLTLAPSSSGTSASSDGPSAGTVVGIVAGSLVCLIVVAALVGALLRKKWGDREEDFQHNPFGDDKSFALIPDQHDANSSSSSPQMQMASMPPGLSRSGTVISNGQGFVGNGSSAPWDHSPTALPPPLPSYQPGQAAMYGNDTNHALHYNNGYSGQDPYVRQGYPATAGYPTMQQHPYAMRDPHGNIAALERAASSRYGAGQQMVAPLNQSNLQSLHQGGEGSRRGENQASEMVQGRSGTPTNANVQQSYFAHSRDNSNHSNLFAHSDGTHSSPKRQRQLRQQQQQQQLPSSALGRFEVNFDNHNGGTSNLAQQLGMYEQTGQIGRPDYLVAREERAKKTLSVRNGAVDEEDAYGGI